MQPAVVHQVQEVQHRERRAEPEGFRYQALIFYACRDLQSSLDSGVRKLAAQPHPQLAKFARKNAISGEDRAIP